MKPPEPPRNNIGAESIVGMQAGEIHNSTVYQVLPGDPPERKYQVGVAYLRDGVPTRARELIDDARAHGYDSAETRFHWVLAMLSRRSYLDLARDERQRLADEAARREDWTGDGWACSLSALHDLLDYVTGTVKDPERALNRLSAMPIAHRDLVAHHLDLVLTGSLKDRFWAETRQRAHESRTSNDRKERVWAYFEPVPAGPRARQPRPDQTTTGDRVRAFCATAAAVVAALFLGKTIVLTAQPLPIAGYLAAVVATVFSIRGGMRWYLAAKRLADQELRYARRTGTTEAADRGFAAEVTRLFDYYFDRYPPAGTEPDRWIEDTAGVRAWLRNEIVEAYRESRTPAGKVKWLIRFLARDVRDQAVRGELFAYREQEPASPSEKAACALSAAAALGLAGYLVRTAFELAPLATAAAVLVLLGGAFYAIRGRSAIVGERARAAAEQLEHDQVMAVRQKEFRRWKGKLEGLLPSEGEMELWLWADKTIVLEKALRHYRLAWRDVLTHAVLQTPAAKSKFALVKHGPRRYAKYDVRLFLITRDGVRELGAKIDFEHLAVTEIERHNFRFDAVSSVYVATPTELSYELELTLTNGDPRGIHVVSAPGEVFVANNADDEDASFDAEMDLEVTGFRHTLHILEGIAAEGKRWIERDPYLARAAAGLAEEFDHTEPV